MKKSLIFWFAAATCAAWILVGCESPTNGDAGAAGTDGPYPLTDAAVDAEALEAAFYVSSRVAITDGSGGIDGEIPAGKILYVLGSAKVASGESLTVKGTLDIYEAAELNASYVSGTAGYLVTSGGAITGTGIGSLPYLAAGVTDGPTGIVTYGNSPGGITKTAGSYIAVSAADPGSALTGANLPDLMDVLPAGASLTVSNITGLTADAVPAGKTLTLAGAGNTVTSNLDLTSAGTLVVKEGAVLDASTYKIDGNVTNNGTIESTATVAANQKALLTLNGAGTVKLGAEGAGAVDSATLALTQNVEIADSGTLKAPVVATPFSGGKTITISGTGVLDFGVAVAGLSLSGVTIVNNGTAAGAITTATTSDAALGVIMGAGGKITASGAITALSQELTVPQDVSLTTDTGVTFATGDFAVTVNGVATFTKGTFAAVNKPVTINGTATFTEAEFTALAGEAGTAILTVSEGVEATFTAATFAAAKGNIVINGEATFGEAAVPGGDVTVAGTLTVANGASLTIDTGKTLHIAQGGIVALKGTGSVVLTPAQATTGGAKITGAGKLTAQDTEISGGTGGWTANSSGTSGKPITTIASTATSGQATITGTDATDTAVLTGGAGATIIQKAGTADNKLTLTTVTVDLSANGSLTLRGDATNGASVVLVAATAIIKGGGTTGSVTTTNITEIGSVTVSGNLTVGADVVFKDNGSGNAFETIKGVASNNAITAKVDLTLDKTTTLTYT